MDNLDIINSLKQKYPWNFDKKIKRIVILRSGDNLKFNIGKILFNDGHNFGVRILHTGDSFMFNKNKDSNVLIFNPIESIYENIFINCEQLIKTLMEEILNLNSDMNTNDLYQYKYIS